ncbi:ABC transporter substrate-binding protein [Kutzneria buriramensis]|uniref:Osmoprotectant transport system substrate-binding protein n=1 Tax=Kutzneria buriramensis TaxID=1045776 RepID=A0A3E0IAW1_9PSEU|nr:ABC transporter substrate-binding protein [Kutzneria buriramensis]REH55873.1 osmoprotectant transport system substrate-binding protein [Kutzneria buriramensis]
MKRTVAGLVTALVAALSLTACGGGSGSDPLAGGNSGSQSPSDTITIGSANFPESQLLAEIYAAALTKAGAKVSKKLNIGSRETYIPALKDGSIDLIPEYSGVLLQYFDKTATATSADDVYAALQKALPSGLSVLDKSAAEDKDAIVVTKETADKYNAKSLADIAPHCGDLVIGAAPEFQKRPDGVPGLLKNYNCTFKDFKSLDADGPLTVAALTQNTVQAADMFTTDSTIQKNGWVVLEDPKFNFAAQNVLPLINTAKASDKVKQALNAISAKLDTKTLTDLNTKLAAPDKPDASKVAADWLATAGI